MLSSVIVKLRKLLALTRIFEFGRAFILAFQKPSMTVEIGATAQHTREYICDPQLRPEPQFVQKKRRQIGKKRDFKMNFS